MGVVWGGPRKPQWSELLQGPVPARSGGAAAERSGAKGPFLKRKPPTPQRAAENGKSPAFSVRLPLKAVTHESAACLPSVCHEYPLVNGEGHWPCCPTHCCPDGGAPPASCRCSFACRVSLSNPQPGPSASGTPHGHGCRGSRFDHQPMHDPRAPKGGGDGGRQFRV